MPRLTVGLCCSQELGLAFYFWLKFGLVFSAYDGKSVWPFWLTVPRIQKSSLVFFTYGSPTVSKDEPQAKIHAQYDWTTGGLNCFVLCLKKGWIQKGF